MPSRRRCCCGGTTICLTACSSPGDPALRRHDPALDHGRRLDPGHIVHDELQRMLLVQPDGQLYRQGGLWRDDLPGGNTYPRGHDNPHLAVSLGSSIICCGGYAIPASLTLTDAVASTTFLYQAGFGSYPSWIGCTSPVVSSATATTPGGVCVVAPAAVQAIAVCYLMQCISTTSPKFTLTRSWGWVYIQGTLTPIWYSQGSGPCTAAGMPTFCSPPPPGSCGSPHVDTSIDSENPTYFVTLRHLVQPDPSAGNYTSDPVGGTVGVSA